MSVPRFDVTNLEAARRIVRRHYRLTRPVTDREVRAEIRSLLRQQIEGVGHDDKDERLWAALSVHVATREKLRMAKASLRSARSDQFRGWER